MGSLDYIFATKKKEEDSISQEAYKLCKDDLKKRAEEEEGLKEIARQNSISALRALLAPWINSLDDKYSLEIN